MEDETLNNILNLLQNANTDSSNSNNTNNANNTIASSSNLNNDIQNLLIKFLLSGGLNQIMNIRNQGAATKESTTPPPTEKPRTIDLTNYQRLD